MTQGNNSEIHVDKTPDCIGLFYPMPIFNATGVIVAHDAYKKLRLSYLHEYEVNKWRQMKVRLTGLLE